MMNREELIGKIKFTYPLINETDYLILESYKKQVAINVRFDVSFEEDTSLDEAQ